MAALALWSALIGFVTHLLIAAELERWQHAFTDHARAITANVHSRLVTNETVLKGFAAFLQAVDPDDRALTAGYAAAVAAASPHIYMLEVARQVPLAELATFEASMRSRWRPDFAVKNFATMTPRPYPAAQDAGATWPIVFMHPERPETDALHGVALETVDNLVQTLAAADRPDHAVASPRLSLYEGGDGYILLQQVPPAAGRGAGQTAVFGGTLIAMLVIRTEALFPVPAASDDLGAVHYRASMATPGHSPNLLFETPGDERETLDGLLLPHLEMTTRIDNAAQPTILEFHQQLRWSQLATRENLALLGLLAVGLLAVPWLVIRHFQSVDQADIAHARAAYLATHDPLTGLPNRFLLLDRFQQALRHWQRSSAPFALLLIDLDGFKEINDQHGHDTGDQVLRAVSIRMQDLLRANDTVARYGGDEFVILLSAVGSENDARLTGEKLLAAISAPVGCTAGQVAVSCSIGIALCPLHGSTLDILRQKADQAMYRAKRSGKGAVTVSTDAALSAV